MEKARAKGSKAVHDLRGSTRDLIATLELLAPFRDKNSQEYKSNSRRCSIEWGLWDVQVQLENLFADPRYRSS